MQELNHETGKALECARYPDSRAHFNENSSRGVNVDLELPCFIHGRVEEGEETLGMTQQTSSDVECFPEGSRSRPDV